MYKGPNHVDNLTVTGPFKGNHDISQYEVRHPGKDKNGDEFTVMFFPSEKHRDGGRGCCDWCEKKKGVSWNCIHVRAVKRFIKKNKNASKPL